MEKYNFLYIERVNENKKNKCTYLTDEAQSAHAFFKLIYSSLIIA